MTDRQTTDGFVIAYTQT